jgi:hypothetical protein
MIENQGQEIETQLQECEQKCNQGSKKPRATECTMIEKPKNALLATKHVSR